MGAFDFFLTNQHEDVAKWSDDAISMIQRGDSPASLDSSKHQRAALVLAAVQ